MARPLSEAIAEMQSLEDVGTPESMAQAAELRTKIEGAGYGDQIPTANPPKPPQAEEPSFLDNWGRPIAEAGGALIGGALGMPGGPPGMMVGAGLGGELAGRASDYLGGREQLGPKDTVMSILFNATGGPAPSPGRAPQALAGLVPEGGLFDYGKGATGSIDDLMPSTPLDRAETAVRERGGMLSPGQKGSTTAAKVEAGLEGTPFGSAPIHQQRDTARNIWGGMMEETVPMAGSREVVGSAATNAYQRNLDYGGAVVEDAYKHLDNIMDTAGGDKRISMESLQGMMREYQHLIERDPGFGELVFQDPDLMRSMDAMQGMLDNGERPTYEVIKKLRTIVGKKVGDAFYQGGEKQGLRDLYRALTNDLDEGAFEVAGEAALNARKNADMLNTNLMRDIQALDPIFSKADNPTAVYKGIASSLVNNPRLAAQAKEAMGEKQWERFVDSWLNMAAMPTPGNASLVGDFSENTFLTSMNRLKQQSPEGYKLLTEGKEGAIEVVEALAKALQEGNQFFNRSNTANALGMQQMAQTALTGGVGGAAGLFTGGPNVAAYAGVGAAAGQAILQRMMAKALTSPRMSKALEAVGSKYGDRLPIGRDLARALVSAGADSTEVKEVMGDMETGVKDKQPPLSSAGNLY